jgi:hypothetical protein
LAISASVTDSHAGNRLFRPVDRRSSSDGKPGNYPLFPARIKPSGFRLEDALPVYFTNGYLHADYRDNPPGGGYWMTPQEIRLLGPSDKTKPEQRAGIVHGQRPLMLPRQVSQRPPVGANPSFLTLSAASGHPARLS